MTLEPEERNAIKILLAAMILAALGMMVRACFAPPADAAITLVEVGKLKPSIGNYRSVVHHDYAHPDSIPMQWTLTQPATDDAPAKVLCYECAPIFDLEGDAFSLAMPYSAIVTRRVIVTNERGEEWCAGSPDDPCVPSFAPIDRNWGLESIAMFSALLPNQAEARWYPELLAATSIDTTTATIWIRMSMPDDGRWWVPLWDVYTLSIDYEMRHNAMEMPLPPCGE